MLTIASVTGAEFFGAMQYRDFVVGQDAVTISLEIAADATMPNEWNSAARDASTLAMLQIWMPCAIARQRTCGSPQECGIDTKPRRNYVRAALRRQRSELLPGGGPGPPVREFRALALVPSLPRLRMECSTA